ncbi:hypothetical protein [Alistipes putredinis]|uniref:hypothetical protein n=1 Tax=Alistipes putredinis TaxID=28117 RepID=UPI003A8C6464
MPRQLEVGDDGGDEIRQIGASQGIFNDSRNVLFVAGFEVNRRVTRVHNTIRVFHQGIEYRINVVYIATHHLVQAALVHTLDYFINEV